MTIKLKRYKPHVLLSYEALLRRLKKRYRFNEIIQSNYQRHKAGFQGEKRIDYKLSLFPKKNFYHYPHLRLNTNQNHFQIDSLLITPKIIFILEIKNLKGILEYSSKYGQIIQIDDGKETGYMDPILQVEIQKQHLINWLGKIGYQIPIEPLVVSTNPYAVIRNIDNDKVFDHRFISLENLLFKLDEIYNSYQNPILTIKEIQFLLKKFIKHNNPLKSNLMKRHKIQSHHLVSGIPCDICERTLLRLHGKWYCKHCNTKFLNSHVRVILDYFLLHNSTITNNQCKTLLQLSSPNIAYKILSSMNLENNGKNKGRKYFSPEIWEFPQNAEPALPNTSILDK